MSLLLSGDVRIFAPSGQISYLGRRSTSAGGNVLKVKEQKLELFSCENVQMHAAVPPSATDAPSDDLIMMMMMMMRGGNADWS